MWEQPPVIGYKVILNPEGRDYEYFIKQSEGGAGWIIDNGLKESELKNWSQSNERERLSVVVNVEWENGHKNVYRLHDLLPIENGFRDVTTVFLDDGCEVINFTEKIEEIIDHCVIVRGRKIVSRYDYNQEYRDKILNHKN